MYSSCNGPRSRSGKNSRLSNFSSSRILCGRKYNELKCDLVVFDYKIYLLSQLQLHHCLVDGQVVGTDFRLLIDKLVMLGWFLELHINLLELFFPLQMSLSLAILRLGRLILGGGG